MAEFWFSGLRWMHLLITQYTLLLENLPSIKLKVQIMAFFGQKYAFVDPWTLLDSSSYSMVLLLSI